MHQAFTPGSRSMVCPGAGVEALETEKYFNHAGGGTTIAAMYKA